MQENDARHDDDEKVGELAAITAQQIHRKFLGIQIPKWKLLFNFLS